MTSLGRGGRAIRGAREMKGVAALASGGCQVDEYKREREREGTPKANLFQHLGCRNRTAARASGGSAERRMQSCIYGALW